MKLDVIIFSIEFTDPWMLSMAVNLNLRSMEGEGCSTVRNYSVGGLQTPNDYQTWEMLRQSLWISPPRTTAPNCLRVVSVRQKVSALEYLRCSKWFPIFSSRPVLWLWIVRCILWANDPGTALLQYPILEDFNFLLKCISSLVLKITFHTMPPLTYLPIHPSIHPLKHTFNNTMQ